MSAMKSFEKQREDHLLEFDKLAAKKGYKRVKSDEPSLAKMGEIVNANKTGKKVSPEAASMFANDLIESLARSKK